MINLKYCRIASFGGLKSAQLRATFLEYSNYKNMLIHLRTISAENPAYLPPVGAKDRPSLRRRRCRRRRCRRRRRRLFRKRKTETR
jgi:hypothetical protein